MLKMNNTGMAQNNTPHTLTTGNFPTYINSNAVYKCTQFCVWVITYCDSRLYGWNEPNLRTIFNAISR